MGSHDLPPGIFIFIKFETSHMTAPIKDRRSRKYMRNPYMGKDLTKISLSQMQSRIFCQAQSKCQSKLIGLKKKTSEKLHSIYGEYNKLWISNIK